MLPINEINPNAQTTWMLFLWTVTTGATPILVHKYKMLSDFMPVMQCDNCRSFTWQDGGLPARGSAHLWAKDMAYDGSKAVVEASVRYVMRRLTAITEFGMIYHDLHRIELKR